MAKDRKQPEDQAEKNYYSIKFQHNEDTFKSLAHMQYDLFCKKNYIARTIIALLCMVFGVLNMDRWWAYLLLAYGAFLATGKYNQSNYTAKKLIDGIKKANLPFPSSRYVFEEKKMRVISLPDKEELSPLNYSEVAKLGKDKDYYYIFRDEHGGYMIPREKLGTNDDNFAEFIQEKTGQIIISRHTPPYRTMLQKWKKRSSEPYHL